MKAITSNEEQDEPQETTLLPAAVMKALLARSNRTSRIFESFFSSETLSLRNKSSGAETTVA
jgi:hypothetical protein